MVVGCAANGMRPPLGGRYGAADYGEEPAAVVPSAVCRIAGMFRTSWDQHRLSGRKGD